ncbi:hypothetical protein [Ensifer soli]|uniref:hypothetical protein n=1 Tax=Ciceribacter sp. sgz301302 TaxID=3342379 RepID=UPI0035B8D5AC
MKLGLKGLRPSRKMTLILAGALVVAGSSGAAALYVMGGDEGGPALMARRSSPSGVECTLIRTLKISRNQQRWIRRYVRADSADGRERALTALRVAGVLAAQEKADLYQVVVVDAKGPETRADIRGAAIGAEVLFAPDPQKFPGFDGPFKAEYRTGRANVAGLFQGEKVSLATDDIRAAMTAMTDRSDCRDPVAEAQAAAAAEKAAAGGGHGGSAAAKHGDETSVEAGQTDAPAEEHAPAGEHAPEGDGVPVADGAGAAHGEAAQADGHGDAPAADGGGADTAKAGGHGDAAAEAEGGMFSSITALVFGKPEAASDHGGAGGGEAAPRGWLDRAKAMVLGDPAGDGEAAAAGSGKGLIDTALSFVLGDPEAGPPPVTEEAKMPPAGDHGGAPSGDAAAHGAEPAPAAEAHGTDEKAKTAATH